MDSLKENSKGQLYHAMTEKQFQAKVIQYAKMKGWLVHHARRMQYASGKWGTPVQGDTGFVDLVLVHPERGALFVELKGMTGRLSPEQKAWLHSLEACGLDARVWKPDSWQEIEEALE